MILYISIDTENKNSKYNKYCDNFIANLSTKLIEELYIKCLRGKNKEMNDYIDYLVKVLKRLIELKSDALMEVFIDLGDDCALLKEINDLLLDTPDEPMSPIKPAKQAFKDFDDIEDIKYYIYEVEIKDADIPTIEVEDIKLVFDYLNFSVLYKLQHKGGEECIKKKCSNNLTVITKPEERKVGSPTKGTSLSAFLGSLISPKTPKK
jgi:hypothetical protein